MTGITYVGDARASGSVASPGPSISYTSTPGNSLILAGSVYVATETATGITAVSDSAGNTWHYSTSNTQNPPSQTGTDGTNTYVTFVAWTFQDVGAVTSVSVHDGTGATDFWGVVLSEWSGIGSADTGAANSAASGTPVSPTITLGNAGDLVVAAADSIGGVSGPPTYFSGAGTATEFTGDSSIYRVYALPGASGAFNLTWGSTGDSAISMMAFSPGSPPPPPPAPTVLYSMRMFP